MKESPAVIFAFYDDLRAEKRRVGGRMTYDCFNAVQRGDKVICRKGRKFKGVGRELPANLVLEGHKNGKCQACKYYNDGGERLGSNI